MQDLVDHLDGGRALRQADGGGHGEAAVGEFVRQLAQRVVAEAKVLNAQRMWVARGSSSTTTPMSLPVDAVPGVAVADRD
jgi:hypothetical protein